MESLFFETELEALNYIVEQCVEFNSLLQVYNQSLVVIIGLISMLLGVLILKLVMEK